LDYEYPLRGTQDLVDKLNEFIIKSKGTIKTATKIKKIDPQGKIVFDQNNTPYEYNQLIWAADQNQLYKAVELDLISSDKIRRNIEHHKQKLVGKRGGDSIFSLFLAVDLGKDYFLKRSSGHCFYTPNKLGQSKVFNDLKDITKATDKHLIMHWMDEYLDYTTYEIAIPALRNEALAPKGKTGLIVSVLMDYDFINNIKSLGFYEEFKNHAEEKIIDVLNKSIFENIKENILHHFSSSPLTIERLSGNLDGGITGWSFTNNSIPAETKTTRIVKSCFTPIPDILQAGQWTFSPSGLPISILTGKIAADQAEKKLRKRMGL
jgi:phytoene dehydrogenase-like protein